MAVVFTANKFTINRTFSMAFKDVPMAASAFLKANPTTPDIEDKAKTIRATGLSSMNTGSLLKDICEWGGRIGPFVYSRVKPPNNTHHKISTVFKKASLSISSSSALSHIMSLKGLGVSFGSKQLRFLDPSQYVVFDSVLQEHLKYGGVTQLRDAKYYPEICKDFQEIANQMTQKAIRNPYHTAYKKSGLSNPRGSKNQWFASDVESAVFSVCMEIYSMGPITAS